MKHTKMKKWLCMMLSVLLLFSSLPVYETPVITFAQENAEEFCTLHMWHEDENLETAEPVSGSALDVEIIPKCNCDCDYCVVQNLVDALPEEDSITAETQESVKAMLEEIKAVLGDNAEDFDAAGVDYSYYTYLAALFESLEQAEALEGEGYVFDEATGELIIYDDAGMAAWKTYWNDIWRQSNWKNDIRTTVKTLTLGSGVTKLDSKVFSQYTGLSLVDMRNIGITGAQVEADTSGSVIKSSPFNTCPKLTRILLPLDWTIIPSAFLKDSKAPIESDSFFEDNPNITEIRMEGLMYINPTKSFTIPSRITKLGYHACIISTANVPLIFTWTSEDDVDLIVPNGLPSIYYNSPVNNASVIVPFGKAELYKGWTELLGSYGTLVSDGTFKVEFSGDSGLVTNAGDATTYLYGSEIKIKANESEAGDFIKWEVVAGDIELADPYAAETTFIMPTKAVTLKAKYGIKGEGYIYDPDAKTLIIFANGGDEAANANTTIANEATIVIVEEGVTQIADSGLSKLANLTQITFPSTLESIGANAITSTKISEVTIPASVKSIGAKAFTNILTTVTVLGETPAVIDNDERPFRTKGAFPKIYVPNVPGVGEAYRAAWTGYNENNLLYTDYEYLGLARNYIQETMATYEPAIDITGAGLQTYYTQNVRSGAESKATDGGLTAEMNSSEEVLTTFDAPGYVKGVVTLKYNNNTTNTTVTEELVLLWEFDALERDFEVLEFYYQPKEGNTSDYEPVLYSRNEAYTYYIKNVMPGIQDYKSNSKDVNIYKVVKEVNSGQKTVTDLGYSALDQYNNGCALNEIYVIVGVDAEGKICELGKYTVEAGMSINMTETKNGTVVARPGSAAADRTVELTAVPDADFVLDTLTVVDENNNLVELTPVEGNENQFTFTMPSTAVTVNATFLGTVENEIIVKTGLKNGSISVDQTGAVLNGTMVKLIETPEYGFCVTEWIVNDATGAVVPVEEIKHEFYFAMPATEATVSAVFGPAHYCGTDADGHPLDPDDWKSWSDALEDGDIAIDNAYSKYRITKSGNYYLDEDIFYEGSYKKVFEIMQGLEVNLCLNGHTIETKVEHQGSAGAYNERATVYIYNGSKVRISNCLPTGGFDCKWSYDTASVIYVDHSSAYNSTGEYDPPVYDFYLEGVDMYTGSGNGVFFYGSNAMNFYMKDSTIRGTGPMAIGYEYTRNPNGPGDENQIKSDHSVYATNCTFIATNGIYVHDGSINLENCIVDAEYTALYGQSSADFTVKNCTITGGHSVLKTYDNSMDVTIEDSTLISSQVMFNCPEFSDESGRLSLKNVTLKGKLANGTHGVSLFANHEDALVGYEIAGVGLLELDGTIKVDIRPDKNGHGFYFDNIRGYIHQVNIKEGFDAENSSIIGYAHGSIPGQLQIPGDRALVYQNMAKKDYSDNFICTNPSGYEFYFEDFYGDADGMYDLVMRLRQPKTYKVSELQEGDVLCVGDIVENDLSGDATVSFENAYYHKQSESYGEVTLAAGETTTLETSYVDGKVNASLERWEVYAAADGTVRIVPYGTDRKEKLELNLDAWDAEETTYYVTIPSEPDHVYYYTTFELEEGKKEAKYIDEFYAAANLGELATEISQEEKDALTAFPADGKITVNGRTGIKVYKLYYDSAVGMTSKHVSVAEYIGFLGKVSGYSIELDTSDIVNADVDIDKETGIQVDEEVTITLTPHEGYEFITNEAIVKIEEEDAAFATQTAENGKIVITLSGFSADVVVTISAGTQKTVDTRLAEAKAAAETELAGVPADNASTPAVILERVKAVVDALSHGVETEAKTEFDFTEATKEHPGSVAGTIVLSLEGKSVEIPVAFDIPQIPLTVDDKLEKAKAAAEAVLEQFAATNETAQQDVMDAVKAAVDALDFGVETAAKADFSITASTKETVGSVAGTIVLSLEGASKEVMVALEIAKIPLTTDEKLAKAKEAAEAVLEGLTPSNALSEERIVSEVKAAVDALDFGVETAAKADFSIIASTKETVGSVTGTIVLSLEDKTQEVIVDYTIPVVNLTAAEKLAEAKIVAEAAMNAFVAANETTVEEILAVVKAEVDALNYGVTTTKKAFTLDVAVEGITGTIEVEILLTLEGEEAVAEATLTIPALPPYDHIWNGEWVVIKEATDTEDGKMEMFCTVSGCGQKKVKTIPSIATKDEVAADDAQSGTLEKDAEVAPDAPIDEATFNNKKAELLENSDIFSETEKEAIKNSNVEARVWLEIAKTDMSKLSVTEQEKVKEEADKYVGGDAVVTYFDADLFKQVGNAEKTSISEPKAFIEISIKVPEELLNTDSAKQRVYTIIRLHGGVIEALSSRFNAATKELIFASDKFSTYAIAYTDAPAEHTHTWVTAWSHDTDYHWHECSDAACANIANADKDGYGSHAYSNSTDSTCNVCGYERTVSSGGGSTGGGSTGGGSTGGGSTDDSSSTPSVPSTSETTSSIRITVPVSNEKNTVNVTAKVDGNTVTLDALKDADVVKLGVVKGKTTIEIDLTGLDQVVDMVEIPTKSLKKIVNKASNIANLINKLLAGKNESEGTDVAEVGLALQLSKTTVTLDATALKALLAQAEGKVVQLNVDDVLKSRLNEAQLKAVAKLDVYKGIEIYFTSNGKRINDFKGGEITVELQFEAPTGYKPEGFSVWYVEEDGTCTKYESSYTEGKLQFAADSFSDIIVVYDEADAAKYIGLLNLRSGKTTADSIELVWDKIATADGYIIYGNKCNANGKVYTEEKIATVKDVNTTNWIVEDLEEGIYYKFYVEAYEKVNGKQEILTKSKLIHAVTENDKYGNPIGVKVDDTKVILAVGETFAIKAEQLLGTKQVANHTSLKYASTNKKVVKVKTNGTITAMGTGTAIIYVYAQNGTAEKIIVHVK